MAIYGECVGAGKRATVKVSGLAPTGCELAAEPADALPDGELSLWIGAIGPLAVIATRRDETHLTAMFSEPLDEKILEHFAFG